MRCVDFRWCASRELSDDALDCTKHAYELPTLGLDIKGDKFTTHGAIATDAGRVHCEQEPGHKTLYPSLGTQH
jgi:hypothetical protein